MREFFVAGNWKMNLNRRESVELAEELKKRCSSALVRLAVCPPFVYLSSIADVLKGANIAVGAQNMYPEPEGAFTGEISGTMLLDIGCRYVILGHSERRHKMGESDPFINAKVLKALQLGLEPIVCIGETIDERKAGKAQQVVSTQIKAALAGVSENQMARVVLAYEPVWAIGTGESATAQQAEQMHAFIRALISDLYNDDVAGSLIIQYGGSVKPSNAADLLSQQNIDGALVGGASLKADSFVPIAEAAVSLSRG